MDPSSSTGDPDADAVIAQMASPAVTGDAPSVSGDPDADAVLHGMNKPHQPSISTTELFEGMGKGLIGGIAHAAGNLTDIATGTAPGPDSYASRWASPFAVSGRLGQLDPDQQRSLDAVSGVYDKAFGTGPAATEIKTRIPQAAEAISTVVPAIKGVGGALKSGPPGVLPAPRVEPTINGMDSPQSLSAAASTPNVTNASPGLQQAISSAAQETGGAVNPLALANHLEADQHGVQLTAGQATRDPTLFSNEQNSAHPAIVARIKAQNEQLTDAIDNVRREASPTAVQNNPIENGQIAVDSLKNYDVPIRTDITAKYNAAKAASAGGNLEMDGSSFVSDANAGLKPQSKFRFLPPTVKGILDDVANNNGRMTLDDYQAYDTQLGNELAKARASQDGNAVAAIGKVQDALHNAQPLGDETVQAKGLFNTARAAAKARFDALDADPAYRAAVDDVSLNGVKPGDPSALADKFLDKYALSAPKANLDRMMGKLDPDAQQAVAAHTLSTIRGTAITPNGNVSANGFNTAIEKYSPKLGSLVSPETQESLDSLGRVITNAKVPPPGHFVNYSKSGVIMNAAGDLGGAAINAKTLGLGLPIIKGIAENNFAKRTLAPGAGLTNLQPTP
ncbi:MAG TPA: hypothetical protein VMS08_00910 [Candidatus Saccharimonadia bacterium]|nr:hypothetical protein [Candidatus Saccharimonadia bacterium]